MLTQFATPAEVEALVDGDDPANRSDYRILNPGHVTWNPSDVEPKEHP